MYHKGLYKEIVCWMYLIGSADKLLSKCRCSVFSTFALLVIFFTEETIDWYSRLFFCLCYSSKKKKSYSYLSSLLEDCQHQRMPCYYDLECICLTKLHKEHGLGHK